MPQLTALGHSGLRIPRVGVGCRALGSHLPKAESVTLIRTALDLGLTFFDTADVYGEGESERLLGQALGEDRHRCVIATKFRHVASHPGAGRKSIRLALEGSLRRLGTDYVDLLQLHAPDPVTPLEETIMTLQDLTQEGKLMYFGLCNVPAWQVVDAQRIAWQAGRAPLVSVQVPLNVVQHEALNDLRPVAERFGVGLLAASPLARGLLGGRYDRDTPPPPGHVLRSKKGIVYWSDRGLAALERVRAAARAFDASPARVALAALLSIPNVSAVLVGARDAEQLKDCSETRPEQFDPHLLRRILEPSDQPPTFPEPRAAATTEVST
jgi:aryl-alcohol dehydrogenase-like predicted oxidoreductase